LGWNDGDEQAQAYTDVNWTASLGVSVKGDTWQRPDDTFGLAGVVSGASSSNQKFLEAGGLGILAGDGALSYGSEKALETYYDIQAWKTVHAAVDYQFISNPAFNRDRGPVSVFGGRFHWELVTGEFDITTAWLIVSPRPAQSDLCFGRRCTDELIAKCIK
jgi:high affinity Mn2+ porin